MSARIPTMQEVYDSKFPLSGGLEVLTSIQERSMAAYSAIHGIKLHVFNF
jgi:hypothetical protein